MLVGLVCKNEPVDVPTEVIYVLGIGEKKQQALKQQNIVTVSQLRNAVQSGLVELSKLQRISLEYHERIVRRINRVCVRIIGEQIIGMLGVNVKSEIVGSYRRGTDQSGDVDILTTYSGKISNHTFANGDTLEIISTGSEKTLAFYHHNDKVYQVDILVTTPKNWAAALLYFTGSKTYNIRMRTHARARNMTLSEHGLYKNDKRIPTPTEESIFKAIGKSYKPPNQRN